MVVSAPPENVRSPVEDSPVIVASALERASTLSNWMPTPDVVIEFQVALADHEVSIRCMLAVAVLLLSA